MSSTTYVTYSAASLRIIIIRYDNTPFYDIELIQGNYTLIRQSTGLCVQSSNSCEEEKSAKLHDRSQNELYVANPTVEQYFVNRHAEEIYDYYRQSVKSQKILQ